MMLSCKEATRLTSEAQDRDLAMMETLGLELHLMICSGCRRYREQMDFLHQACQHHPVRPAPDEKKSP
jgi:hypothetical protein